MTPLILEVDSFGPMLMFRAVPGEIIARRFRLCRSCLAGAQAILNQFKMEYSVYPNETIRRPMWTHRNR
ncbi:hypothetical protein LCGC14_0441480 [marine sediment metagenome]|uniref:Uncharacterized protein n=1 Tax=marine sediment metagenome TaxID=412755 RepID=A0A0F9V7D0_9ZZZZ